MNDSTPTILAIDAMGGDVGPQVTLNAALLALQQDKNLNIILVGRQDEIEGLLAKPHLRLHIHNAHEVVMMDESPQSALKNKKQSSMRLALDLVKSGRAKACVSAGNTGALMAMARFVLKTLPGIDRPAIASAMPSRRGMTYVLDLGANADCTPEHLLQFAVMGSALVASVENKASPSIGLLNIGTEDIKGNEVVRQASELLRASHLNFYGNVEGDDIFEGTTDVVVCDGFVGNVALKASEGLAHLIVQRLGAEFKRNFATKLTALVAWPVLRAFKTSLDPRCYNGASFLGLRGIVIKSHGGADSFAFLHAIQTAVREVRSGILERISTQLEAEHQALAPTREQA